MVQEIWDCKQRKLGGVSQMVHKSAKIPGSRPNALRIMFSFNPLDLHVYRIIIEV